VIPHILNTYNAFIISETTHLRTDSHIPKDPNTFTILFTNYPQTDAMCIARQAG